MKTMSFHFNSNPGTFLTEAFRMLTESEYRTPKEVVRHVQIEELKPILGNPGWDTTVTHNENNQ